MKLTLLELIVLGILTLCLFSPQTVLAEEEDDCPDCPKEEERVKLDDVFVHAFGGGAITYTPTSTIVDVDKYVKAGKVERVEDILMNIAGIDVMKNSGSPDPQAVIMMRGFDDSRFIVAINGRPITGSSGKANNTIDWASLTLSDIEKIEIVRGGASAAYESAEGGVINIIMKKGVKRDTLVPRITYTQDYSVNFDYSDPSSHSERITADGGVGDLTYFLNYGHQSDDGYLKNNQFRGNDYSARLNYLFPFEGLLTFSYKYSKFNRENIVVNWPTVLGYDPNYPKVPEDADTIRNRSVSYYLDGLDIYKEKTAKHLDVAFEQPIKDTNLKIYYYKTENAEDNWRVAYDDNDTPADPSDDVYTQQFSGGDAETEMHVGGGVIWSLEPWEDNSLTLGYNFKKTGAKEMHDIFRIHAGYFEDLWRISDKWELKTGLRVSKARQSTYPFTLDPSQAPELKYRHKYRDWFILPKIAVTYNIRPETNVYVSVSKDYDVPGC